MGALQAVVLMVALAIGAGAWWQGVVRRSPIDPVPTLLPTPPPPRTGPYHPNARLQDLRRLGDGLLPHPEDLVAVSHRDQDGKEEHYVYAACGDGWIKRVRIFPEGEGGAPDEEQWPVQNWTYVGGRPLGIVAGLHGELLVCEPTLGLLNVTRGHFSTLTDNLCGLDFKFADGLDVAKDGSIYFTDASTKYTYGASNLDVLEGRPHGRLLKYEPVTQSTTVLLDSLYFPNGVAISQDQTFLVFCETAKVRCRKYWLVGEKKGQHEIFIDNLPGYPDNIHSTKRGTFWIALVSGRSFIQEMLFTFPLFKHLIASSPKALHSLNVANSLMAKALEVTNDGEPIRLLEDPNGAATGFVTGALEVGDSLYLGSLSSNFIGKLKL